MLTAMKACAALSLPGAVQAMNGRTAGISNVPERTHMNASDAVMNSERCTVDIQVASTDIARRPLNDFGARRLPVSRPFALTRLNASVASARIFGAKLARDRFRPW